MIKMTNGFKITFANCVFSYLNKTNIYHFIWVKMSRFITIIHTDLEIERANIIKVKLWGLASLIVHAHFPQGQPLIPFYDL